MGDIEGEMSEQSESYSSGRSAGFELREDSVPQLVVEELDWRWIAAALSGQLLSPANTDRSATGNDDEGALLSKKKWSGMRLVDTVVLDESGDVESWLFTAKTGEITTKKTIQDQAKIVERFKRFALANSKNTEEYVALVSNGSHEHTQSAERTVMDKKSLEEAMTNLETVSPELLGATLQCYLRPQHGSNSFLRVRYQAAEKSVLITKVSPLFQWVKTTTEVLPKKVTSSETGSQMFVDGDPDVNRLQHGIKTVLGSLVAFLEPRLRERGAAPTTIYGCAADFVVDDNGELWLISVPTITVTPGSIVDNNILASVASGTTRQHTSDDDDMGTKETTLTTIPDMPPLRAAVADVSHSAPANGGGTPFTTSREGSLESSSALTLKPVDRDKPGNKYEVDDKPLEASQVALPKIPKMLGARGTPGEHNSGKATPIIQKTGGVYVANMHASALRGLCCWREVGCLSGWRTNVISEANIVSEPQPARNIF